MNESENEIWSGCAEIWTADTYHIGIWPKATLTTSENTISVSVPKNTVQFSADQIVESRIFRLPLPSLTIIFQDDDCHSLISFSHLRMAHLERVLRSRKILIQDQRVWRTGFEAGQDEKKYRLQSNS